MRNLQELETVLRHEAQGLSITRENCAVLADQVVPYLRVKAIIDEADRLLPEYEVMLAAGYIETRDYIDMAIFRAAVSQWHMAIFEARLPHVTRVLFEMKDEADYDHA